MKEREKYMLCCSCGYAVKDKNIFKKAYQNTAICLCRKCAKELVKDIENWSDKAEIERLKSANDEKFHQWDMLAEKTKQHYADLYNEAKNILKSEAIKDFAERLKEKADDYVLAEGEFETMIFADDIDNLVKEMTEVQE